MYGRNVADNADAHDNDDEKCSIYVGVCVNVFVLNEFSLN